MKYVRIYLKSPSSCVFDEISKGGMVSFIVERHEELFSAEYGGISFSKPLDKWNVRDKVPQALYGYD